MIIRKVISDCRKEINKCMSNQFNACVGILCHEILLQCIFWTQEQPLTPVAQKEVGISYSFDAWHWFKRFIQVAVSCTLNNQPLGAKNIWTYIQKVGSINEMQHSIKVLSLWLYLSCLGRAGLYQKHGVTNGFDVHQLHKSQIMLVPYLPQTDQ
jgi:hypothetical protein